jgi:FkbM family methyltransferase
MKSSAKRPLPFVLASTNHGSMLVNRLDYNLVNNTAYGVGFQLLNSSAFDQEEIDVALKLLSTRRTNFGDGVVAIDCGANIGAHTIEWAKQMHDWGSVMAFEAQERIFYALAGNITLNNCFNARAIWAAVGATCGEIGVPVPNYLSPASFGSLEIRKKASTEFIGQEVDYANLQPTRLVSIDSLGFHRVDLIKIDIEGMEMEALLGARETIATYHPQLIIEKIKSNEVEISNFLSSLGYKIFHLGINFLAIHPTDPVCEHFSQPLKG